MEEYPDLITWEFLSVYHVNCLDESMCSFQACIPGWKIATLEQ